MARRAAYKRNKANNKLTVTLVLILLIGLGILVAYQCREIQIRIDDKKARQAELTKLIEEEKEKQTSIEEYEEYTHSKAYIEDNAPKDFGLVYDNQIIFKPAK